MKGLIIAAGYGTRFLPATKTVPKEMLPLMDKPSIAFIVEEMIQSGIKDIVIITSRRKKCMDDFFDREVELERELSLKNKTELLEKIKPYRDVNICFIRQQEMKGVGRQYLLYPSAGDERRRTRYAASRKRYRQRAVCCCLPR